LPFLGVLIFSILGSSGLAISAFGYRRGKYFGRSPSVLANLIALGVVSYMFQAEWWFVGGALAILALTTLVATLRAVPTNL
jgi:membrane protein YdbS with pleckstrin-like domain